jgi:hypothetical protein
MEGRVIGALLVNQGAEALLPRQLLADEEWPVGVRIAMGRVIHDATI